MSGPGPNFLVRLGPSCYPVVGESIVEPWKVVYVDDSRLELKAVEQALVEAGHAVTPSLDGELPAGAVAGADLVLIDYHLAGTTGKQVFDKLAASLAGSADRPLFYLYTSDQEVGSDYRELGFDGRLILKGNQEALLRQLSAVQRAAKLRGLRPSQ